MFSWIPSNLKLAMLITNFDIQTTNLGRSYHTENNAPPINTMWSEPQLFAVESP